MKDVLVEYVYLYRSWWNRFQLCIIASHLQLIMTLMIIVYQSATSISLKEIDTRFPAAVRVNDSYSFDAVL